ncbi:MAG: peptidylprolyl isomerase [Planctomycetota bacterium]
MARVPSASVTRLAVGLCGLLIAGCSGNGGAGVAATDQDRSLSPSDFVTVGYHEYVSVSASVAEPADPQLVSSEAPGQSAAPPPVASDGFDRDDDLLTPLTDPRAIDGMVGQINGEPVYAEDVLGDLSESLRAKGRQLSTGAFRREARESIERGVEAVLRNRLFMAEAERSLTENEWNGVRFMVANRRKALLREHGMGSLKAADRKLRQETGYGLDETLARFQDLIVTDTYVGRNLRARVNVTRRDIERFYREHEAKFNPPDTRDLTLIVVRDEAARDAVLAELDSGVPFAEVAAGPYNALGRGGVMEGVEGDAPFGRPDVEAAMRSATPGSWAGPIEVDGGRFWFVRVDRFEAGRRITLEDAQGPIEKQLNDQQYNLRVQQFQERLVREGNFTPREQMIRRLTDIAVSRYAVR